MNAKTAFENTLGVFERWVSDIYRQHLGCSLKELHEYARQVGCPRPDVDKFWKKWQDEMAKQQKAKAS